MRSLVLFCAFAYALTAHAGEHINTIVNSLPSGADIYINEQATGRNTPARIHLECQTCNIDLKKPKFEIDSFEIKANKIKKVYNRTLVKAKK